MIYNESYLSFKRLSAEILLSVSEHVKRLFSLPICYSKMNEMQALLHFQYSIFTGGVMLKNSS